ncbi:DUF7389 domain-containing protein [Natronosalvus rutilus]|uniref:DUF7389 domain-containing protein n=1 Tax=Natronosalvus rutilus TaxID=2953753 RepID=A0A9E7NCS0_9EURY|nr:hypothetical protein [Natronosalvus rutilus]UTF56039.1 hypothetical protein NGM29_20850 [Natronosalvus rutilus]
MVTGNHDTTDEPNQNQATLTDGDDTDSLEYEAGRKEPLDHGVKVRAKVKRGTATRDQDELLLEGRGEDAEEAAADFEAALTMAEENGWTDRLRALQPDEADEEGDA